MFMQFEDRYRGKWSRNNKHTQRLPKTVFYSYFYLTSQSLFIVVKMIL